MQKYRCFLCDKDSAGGRTTVFEGMFFKLCAECAESEDLYKEFRERMLEEMENEEQHPFEE